MASDAVGSVARILDRVLQHQHFIVENREEVESFFHEVTSLQAILENSSHNLESEIVKSAYEARDLMETHIGEQIIRANNLIFSSYESLDEAKDEFLVVAQGQNLCRGPSKIDDAELQQLQFFSTRWDLYQPDVIDVHSLTIYSQNIYGQRLVRCRREQAEFLLEKVSLLHGIIRENSSGKTIEEIKSLENQIINVEKRVKAFTEPRPCFMEYNLTFSPECLTKAQEKIDLVKTLIEKIDMEGEEQNMRCLSSAAASIPAAPVANITAEDFMKIKNKLAEESSKLEIVSLVGMGGIGKTTLARDVYHDKFFTETFPICGWVTISQSYDRKKALTDLLDSMKKDSVDADKSDIKDLGERLYKSLKGWKYLIIIDDVWDTKVWDDLRRLFPDDRCSSRILLTSRLEDVAIHANSYLHHVHFLDEGKSWNLFCNKVFGENACPPQLEKIGKKIVGNCHGLPLSIVAIGGLLSRITKTQEHWENISHDLSSVTLSGGTDHCLQVLPLSYTHLSDHMKKCFLYIGIFPEDNNIFVSRLVKLWIAEGFIKPPCSYRLMEDVAYETLVDLIGRSLVLVDEFGSTGKIKTCKIHDLVRDFCMREARREMLFHITDPSLYGIPMDAKIPVCLSVHPNKQNIIPCDNKKLSCLEVSSLHIFDPAFNYLIHHLNHEPLKVLDWGTRDRWVGYSESDEFFSRNLRYLSFNRVGCLFNLYIPSSSLLPKLQTLILPKSPCAGSIKFSNMWNMAELRHVKVSGLYLSDCVEGENSTVVLENLQTLSQVCKFRWSKEVVLRIPNLKKLGIIYRLEESDWKHYCLENLMYLEKLESLTCAFLQPCPSLLHILSFPPSLKKLTLKGCGLPWRDMKIVSRLPNLEVLKLRDGSFAGKQWEWESADEEFPKLKHLLLQELDLELWAGDSVNFPCLQRLIISRCGWLKEIPRCIGELSTLQLIELRKCDISLRDFVKKMQEEEMEFGNDCLKVHITHW